MRKLSLALLTVVMLLSVILAGCSSSDNKPGNTDKDNASGKQVTIKMFQYKVEIAEQLSRMIKEYEALTPGVKIELETVGGGADYNSTLRTKFNSSEKPDIFNNGGFSDLDLWVEHLEDFSDEPWAADLMDIAKEPMTKDGKLYGQPLTLEGYGFVYNKDLFEQAGIEQLPKTLEELEAVAIKLQAVGITPFVNGYGEWWVLGNHLANIAFAHQPNPNEFIASLYDGSNQIPGNEIFDQWLDLFDLTLKYGGKNPLQTDYSTEISEFASGKAAMTQQGNWTQVAIMQTNPDINIGLLPMPINNDKEAMDKLPVGVPSNWVIHKNSPVKEEAKAFLNWMATSDIGQRYITEEFKSIPPFKSMEANVEVLGQMSADIVEYIKADKTLSYNYFKFPGGEATGNEFGNVMQAYIGGKSSREQLLNDLQKTWDTLSR
ncbi:carbohydrate ABC transporter substrate-binding protein [Paenibacillaceae bacterium]|nr:carbohydrate ABC transporter substrate-binding protein [Paenibacillaceae bacterium]